MGKRQKKRQEGEQVYDSLWESHPKVKQLRAEVAASKAAVAATKARERAEGELREARRMFISIVKVRFPALAELAEQEAAKITNAGAFELLTQQVVAAPDENFARLLLSSPIA